MRIHCILCVGRKDDKSMNIIIPLNFRKFLLYLLSKEFINIYNITKYTLPYVSPNVCCVYRFVNVNIHNIILLMYLSLTKRRKQQEVEGLWYMCEEERK